MRIGILTSAHPATDTRIFFKQARSLARAGHEVTLVGGGTEEVRAVPHIPVRAASTHAGRLRCCATVLWRAAGLRCDAYHIHDPELLPGAVILKLFTRARLVYDVHENVRAQILNKHWIPRGLRRAATLLYVIVERICTPFVDHWVLAESSYGSIYRGPRVTVVRNYPIVDDSTSSAISRTYSRKPILAYCGTVERIRGAFEMIELVALLKPRFPDVELRIIGPFYPSNLDRELRERIDRRSLTRNVRLLGRLQLDLALRELRRADIGLALLHPDANYVESLPTKMFEYMMLGLPVVVSDFPLWRSIVEPSRCGLLVDPMSPDRAARAIADLVDEPRQLVRMGRNGVLAVRCRYHWGTEETKLLEVYAGMRSTPHRPPSGDPAASASSASREAGERSREDAEVLR